MESILKDLILTLSYLVFLFILILIYTITIIIRKEKIIRQQSVSKFDLSNVDIAVDNLNLKLIQEVTKLKKENKELIKICENISRNKIEEIDDITPRKFSMLNIDKKTFWIYFFIILIIVIFLILIIVNPNEIFYIRGV